MNVLHNIYLVQAQYLSMSPGGRKQYWLPYSVGCLWAYAKTFEDIVDKFNLKELMYAREPHNDILDRLDNPSLMFFSNYTWNEQYNLKLAKSVKEKHPNTIIVFGGPSTTEGHTKFSFIDSVVLLEGEMSFVQLLRDYLNEEIKTIYISDRITDLSILPSPYTTGVFDDILKTNPDFWQATVESNRGCPFSCTFCDWGSLTNSKIKLFPLEKLEAELKWFKEHKVTYLYLTDGNFGIFKDRDLGIAHMIRDILEDSLLDGIFLNWTKNSGEVVVQMLKILIKWHTRGLTLATQSMDPKVLKAIKRKNLANGNFSHLFKLLDKEKIPYYTEFILGLPEESLESWKKGLTDVLEMGQHDRIDFWLTDILPGSELAHPSYIEKYDIKTKIIYNNLNFNHDNDEVLERQRIVVSTNTMSSEEMIEAYIYAWMIQSFHSSGFSQYHARLARKHGISYRDFYDRFFEKIKNTQPLKDHYYEFRSEVEKTILVNQNSDVKFTRLPDSHSLDFIKNNIDTIDKIGKSILDAYNLRPNRIIHITKDTFNFDSVANRKKQNISSVVSELLI